MALLVAIVDNTAMIAVGWCSASWTSAIGLHAGAMLCAARTYGARHCREESSDQLIENPASMAKFSIALFCL
ncbi:hypothetical protein ACFIOY_32525 [Bradyrhizobium sp. TZ2]